jgi:hypothetical protein
MVRIQQNQIKLLEGENTILADTIVEHEMREENHAVELEEERAKSASRLVAQNEVHRQAQAEMRAVESRLRKELRMHKADAQSAEERAKVEARKAEEDQMELLQDFDEELKERDEHKAAFISRARSIKQSVMERTRKLAAQDREVSALSHGMSRRHVPVLSDSQQENLCFSRGALRLEQQQQPSSPEATVTAASASPVLSQASPSPRGSLSGPNSSALSLEHPEPRSRHLSEMELFLQRIFAQVDLNKDGRISFQDWMRAVSHDERLERLLDNPAALFNDAYGGADDGVSFEMFVQFFREAGLLQ